MKNKLFIVIGILILLLLMSIAVLLPNKDDNKEKKIEMLGIDYNVDGNEVKLEKYNIMEV